MLSCSVPTRISCMLGASYTQKLSQLNQSNFACEARGVSFRRPFIVSMTTSTVLKELREVEDFNSISHSDGLLSIGGFGSLLSEKSARYTFPALQNFRIAKLKGFRRVFGHTAPIFFERGIANLETKEVSSVSVEPCEGEITIITVFEIGISEVPAFMEREHEFRFLAVLPETIEGTPYTQPVVVCAHSSDEIYHERICKGDTEVFFSHYGKYGIDKIWRTDILPCRTYLRHCVLAAKNLGDLVWENFLDHSYLGDRVTTIRQHLESHPQLMEEEPPELLRERYGG